MSQTIEALEKIEQSQFHNLCDDLLSDYFRYKGILPIGIHTKKRRTIMGTPDSVIFKGKKSAIAFEYTTNKNFKNKLLADLKVVKEKIEGEGIKIKEFVFVTSGKRKDINGKSPERYIRDKYGWNSCIIDQEALRIPLDISRYFYLRRKYLNIPFDYFISKEKYESLFKDSATRASYYTEIFFDREQEISFLRDFILKSEKKVLLIYSNGGIGKTRFIIEAIKQFENDESFKKFDFLFNDPYQTKIQISDHINELSPEDEKISVVILDDAHKIDALYEFQRILSERKNSKIIVLTRSTAKEKVKLDLEIFEIEDIALNHLDDEIIYNQLEKNIKVSTTKEFLEYVTHYCNGNPLIAEIFSTVINENKIKNLNDLKSCDPLKEYFHRTLEDIEKNQQKINQKYKPYVALVFGFKPFLLSELKFIRTIRKILFIDEVEENLIIRNLVSTGILESVGNTLWIYPDLLGEYIFNDVFFGDKSILNIEDVFKKIPSSKLESILKTLRELNNTKSNDFLNKISLELVEAIEKRDNDERIRLLELLEIVAYNVPDQAFVIVRSLVESEEIPPKKYESPFPFTGREHIDVLIKCLDILNIIKYDYFDDVVEILARLYFYKENDKSYDQLREKTLEALLELCKYDFFEIRRYGYFFKKQLFKIITKWRIQNLQEHWIFITRLNKELLSPEVEYQHTSPLDPMKFHFGRWPIIVNSDLIKLRKDILACLNEIFYQVDNIQQKIEILESIFGAVRYPINTEPESDVERIIFENRIDIVEFLSGIVKESQSAVVKRHIEQEAVFMKRTERREFQELDILISELRKDEFYDLYRMFVGRELDYSTDDSEDWKEARKKRVEKIDVIASKINEENFEYWFSRLDRIAETYQEGKDFEFYLFRQFCFTIGKKKSKIAKKIVEVSIEKNLPIKNFVSFFLGGIKSSIEGKIADGFIEDWINTEKIDLILKIPEVYSWTDEECLKKRDVNVFKKLSDHPLVDKDQRNKLDQKIMANIFCVCKKDPKTAIRIIINLFKRAAPEYSEIYSQYIETAHIRNQIDLSQWGDSDLYVLIEEFIKISNLSHEHVGILAIYGKRHPFKLIEFFEARIRRKNRMKDKLSDEYNVIPSHLHEISEMFRAHPMYSRAIKRILNWMERDDWIYKAGGIKLILKISQDLDEKISKVLEDYISSERKEKILIAVKILNNYSQKHIVNYDLLKQSILKSKGDEDILNAVSLAIIKTGFVWGENGFINEYERKIKSLENWKKDEDKVVREFTNKLISSFKSMIEEEKKRIKERKIKFKKGIF